MKALLLIGGLLVTAAIADDQAELEAAGQQAKADKIQALRTAIEKTEEEVAAAAKGGRPGLRMLASLRMKLKEQKANLEKQKAAKPELPQLNLSELKPGQIGILYRLYRSNNSFTAANGQRVNAVGFSPDKVGVQVESILDASRVAVVETGPGDNPLLVIRMNTAGLVTGKKFAIEKPIKVLGTCEYEGETVMELKLFE